MSRKTNKDALFLPIRKRLDRISDPYPACKISVYSFKELEFVLQVLINPRIELKATYYSFTYKQITTVYVREVVYEANDNKGAPYLIITMGNKLSVNYNLDMDVLEKIALACNHWLDLVEANVFKGGTSVQTNTIDKI